MAPNAVDDDDITYEAQTCPRSGWTNHLPGPAWPPLRTGNISANEMAEPSSARRGGSVGPYTQQSRGVRSRQQGSSPSQIT